MNYLQFDLPILPGWLKILLLRRRLDYIALNIDTHINKILFALLICYKYFIVLDTLFMAILILVLTRLKGIVI